MNSKYTLPILIGLSVTGISAAYLLYLLLRKDEDELGPHVQRIKTSRPAIIEVKIPKECVGVVIGRGGSSIKDIQDKTATKINFRDELETEQHRVCVIRGTPEGAQLAESLIHDIILNQPLIETYEMFVPQNACGRIIGKNGDTIRSISRASNAHIIVDSNLNSKELNATRRVLIKGTTDQIEVAKSLIEEKVVEEIEMRGRIHQSLEKRSPRKRTGPQYLMSAEAVEDEHTKRHNTESLLATGKDGFMEVYVSAVEHPGRFWVQVIGPRAVELDHLVEEMSEFYKLEENREFHTIKEITVDQLVAAPFSHDDKWYRARVIDVTVDDYDAEESQIDLYYLDYGDSDTRRKKEVYSLRADFLKLRYQAIESTLAKVKPTGSGWTDEATDLFEDLCHVAQWRVLMSRVDSYKERERGKREGSPIPAVELFDTSGAQDISVAEELVKQGYADWEKSPGKQQQASKQLIEAESGNVLSSGKSNTVIGTTSAKDRKGTVDSSTVKPVQSNNNSDSVLPPKQRWTDSTNTKPAEEYPNCSSDNDDELEMG